MILHGKEIRFAFTVSAYAALAEECPEHDGTRFGSVYVNAGTGEKVRLAQLLVYAMADGYDRNMALWNQGHKPQCLTYEEIDSLKVSELMEAAAEAFRAIREDMAPSVEVEPGKKKEDVTSS